MLLSNAALRPAAKRKRPYVAPRWTQPVGRPAYWRPYDGQGSEVVVITAVNADSVTTRFQDSTSRTFTGPDIEEFLEPLPFKEKDNVFGLGLSQYVPLKSFQQEGDVLVTYIVREKRPRLLWRGDVVSVRLERNSEGFFQIYRFITKRGTVVGVRGRWLYTMKAAMKGLPDVGVKYSEEDPQLLLCSEEAEIDIDTINEPISVKPHYMYRPGQDDYYVKNHFDFVSKILTPIADTVCEDLLMCKYRSDLNLANDLHRMNVEETRKRMHMMMASRVARLKESPAGQDLDYDVTWQTILNFEEELLMKAELEFFDVKQGRKTVTEVNITWRVSCGDLEPELGDDWNQLPICKRDPASDKLVLDGTIVMRWCHTRPNKLRMRVETVCVEKSNGVNLVRKSIAPPAARPACPAVAEHAAISDESDYDSDDEMPLAALAASGAL